jgi:cysteine desulfuration protein SufE
MENGLVYFEAEADSLISSGLAALLIRVYSGEAPETILKCPADYLLELGINASLTMNRANGLASMHLHMKRAALTLLMQEEQSKT